MNEWKTVELLFDHSDELHQETNKEKTVVVVAVVIGFNQFW